MLLQNMFATALGIPVIMIVMPLFSVITQLSLTNHPGLIIFFVHCHERAVRDLLPAVVLPKPVVYL